MAGEGSGREVSLVAMKRNREKGAGDCSLWCVYRWGLGRHALVLQETLQTFGARMHENLSLVLVLPLLTS